MKRAPARRTLPLLAASTAVVLSLFGCSGGDFGSELKMTTTPKRHPFRSVEGESVRIPADDQFSIAVRSNEESPAIDGDASSEAHYGKNGTADAKATVANGGTARAGFQLGHAFENDTDRQVDLELRVRCSYATEVSVTPVSAMGDGRVDLQLFARNGRHRLIQSFALVRHSTDDGAASSADSRELNFTITLAPHETADVFLSGNVVIETVEGRSASGSIRLSKLEIDATTKPAPPVQTVGDERG